MYRIVFFISIIDASKSQCSNLTLYFHVFMAIITNVFKQVKGVFRSFFSFSFLTKVKVRESVLKL